MKLSISAFSNDHLHLTRWDLVKLFFGRRLQSGALIVETRPNAKPTPPGPRPSPFR